MGTRHNTFGPPSGNRSKMPVSRHTESRFGPSHCGQSSALAMPAAKIRRASSRMWRARVIFMSEGLVGRRWVQKRLAVLYGGRIARTAAAKAKKNSPNSEIFNESQILHLVLACRCLHF